MNQDPTSPRMIRNPANMLKEVIRLLQRNCNFSFVDETLNVRIEIQHQLPVGRVSTPEDWMRQLWNLISGIYLRPVSQQDISVLNYATKFVQQKMPESAPHHFTMEFWNRLNKCLSPAFLEKLMKAYPKDLQVRNWLNWLHLFYQFIMDKNNKLGSLKKGLFEYRDTFIPKNKKVTRPSTHKQKVILSELEEAKKNLSEQPSSSDEIHQLSRKLEEINGRNKDLVYRLKLKVATELKYHQIVYYCGERENEIMIDENITEEKALCDVIREVDVQKDYLASHIQVLQKKQVAESIAKIAKVRQRQEKFFYTVEFEKGVGVESQEISEEQLLEYNKARDMSLFKETAAVQKSKWSVMSPNLAGFSRIYAGRQIPPKLTEEDILEELKKKTRYPREIVRKFANLEMCHFCKCLLSPEFLQACAYRSQEGEYEVEPVPYYDPYLHQVQQQRNEVLQWRQQNLVERYPQFDNKYYCVRMFCLSCIDANDLKFNNGYCPFCQSTCCCSRCVRNQLIKKLKTKLLMLGGNPNLIDTNFYSCPSSPREDDRQAEYLPEEFEERRRHLKHLCGLILEREKKKQANVQARSANLSSLVAFFNQRTHRTPREDKPRRRR